MEEQKFDVHQELKYDTNARDSYFFEKGNEAIILFKSWSRDQGDLQSESNVLWTCSTANQAIKVLEECKQA